MHSRHRHCFWHIVYEGNFAEKQRRHRHRPPAIAKNLNTHKACQLPSTTSRFHPLQQGAQCVYFQPLRRSFQILKRGLRCRVVLRVPNKSHQKPALLKKSCAASFPKQIRTTDEKVQFLQSKNSAIILIHLTSTFTPDLV